MSSLCISSCNLYTSSDGEGRKLQGKAWDSLAMFYEACAQIEIDEFRDYQKALQVNSGWVCMLLVLVFCLGDSLLEGLAKQLQQHEPRQESLDQLTAAWCLLHLGDCVAHSPQATCIHETHAVLISTYSDIAEVPYRHA